MRVKNTILLVLIALLAILMLVIDLSQGKWHLGKLTLNLSIRQGLDLKGGTQVLLEADLPVTDTIETGALREVASIIDNRVNALGVSESLVQTQGSRRIIVELPGVEDPDQAIATVREQGLLEFIDTGSQPLEAGTIVRTTFPLLESQGAKTHSVEPGSSESLTSTLSTTPVTQTAAVTSTKAITNEIFATVLIGAPYLKSAVARIDQSGKLGVAFELSTEGAQIFGEYTARNIGKYLTIVLDKVVISSPVIQSAIPDGKGEITGNFTQAEAQKLAVQLRYGALPFALKVETTRSVGPSLGQDSIQRSIRAGIVGLSIVLLFMLVYYRLPGLLADLALILYGLINFAVFKAGWPVLLVVGLLMIVEYLIDRRQQWALFLGGALLAGTIALAISGFTGVVLTLPAITGFILSTGMAVDANILVFERMKEELRAGKSLGAALEAGFSRAWTSIRDSNISTLITCAILYYFGSAFAAGSVRGFAITLALGVVINLFTAITVTRTLMRAIYDWRGERMRDSALLAAR